MDCQFIKIILLLLLLTSVRAYSQQPETARQNDVSEQPSSVYRIRQDDKLSVKFLYQPELNETSLTVRPDGFISLQLIEEVKAAGLTVSELKIRLEKMYDGHLLKPVISIALIEFVAPSVFIGGQVGKPGSYRLRDGQTIVQVISFAGGFTADASRKTVLHARTDNTGEWQIQVANVAKILNRKAAEKDLVLREGDYIFVPDSRTSRINKALESFRGLLPRLF